MPYDLVYIFDITISKVAQDPNGFKLKQHGYYKYVRSYLHCTDFFREVVREGEDLCDYRENICFQDLRNGRDLFPSEESTDCSD